MKKAFSLIICGLLVAFAANAQAQITKRDRIEPTDEVYIDMATEAAKASVKEGGAASGAVIILNNAFHSSGKGVDAEMNALGKARVNSLENAKLYTINEPTPATVVEYSKRGVQAIFFVNPSTVVINAGVHSADDYAPVTPPEDLTIAPLIQISYPDAIQLLTK